MNIGSVVNVEQVVERVKHEPNVVLATHTMFTCSDTSLSNIKEMIHQHRLNRIVVASCTPRTHEPLFRETLREAGLNPYLFEMTNIRDQCSWVHSNAPEFATEKAVELVKMSVARARTLWPLEGGTLTVDQTGIVIGGGLSGMTAALALANQGFSTHLIEQANRLGGTLHDIHRTFEHEDIAAYTAGLIAQVQKHPRIQTHLEAEVASIKGHIGKFHVTLAQGAKKVDVTGGAIIVATGAQPAKTTEFLYGKSDRVLTQAELEKQLHEKTWSAKGQNIVMIQCVGSRNEKHPYCSRICCSMAVKNALAVKKLDPAAQVYVLYRDVRTYGFREIYYQQAREAGVVFIRYTPEAPPQVTDDNGLVVTLPGRAGGFPPAPPQSRTSPIKAYGSSGGTASLHSRRYPWGLVHRHSDLRVSGLLPPHGSVCPRPLPSLLPGFLGLVRRLSIGTMKRLRLPPRFSPRSVRHIATEYPGLAWLFRSLRRASPLPQGPDVVKPVHPSRRLVPRTRTGLPCSQGTPMCLCPALGPRPDLDA
jgi:heterodisulfide reductase subunit A